MFTRGPCARLCQAGCIAAAVVVAPAGAQTLSVVSPESAGMSSARLARLSEAVRLEIRESRFPGAVIAVARKGKLVFYESFGQLDRTGTPMPKDAIFYIASMTKPLTAAAALSLQEEGRLLLNDPVGNYLPELSKMPVAVLSEDGQRVVRTEPARRPITVAHLLQHTAGIPSGFIGTTELHRQYAPFTPSQNPQLGPEAILAGVSKLPLLFQPGSEWEYGLGLDILGLVIERVTGQPLGRVLEQRLFAPLAMRDTAFMVPAGKAARYARLTESGVPGGKPLDATIPRAMDCGGACAVSTAMDYLRFALMLQNGGQLQGTRVLSRKSVEAMTADQLGDGVDRTRLHNYGLLNGGYGFGLGVAVRHGNGGAGMMGTADDFHWGGAGGTYFWVDPKEELAVVFMAAAPAARLRSRQLLPALVLQAIVD